MAAKRPAVGEGRGRRLRKADLVVMIQRHERNADRRPAKLGHVPVFDADEQERLVRLALTDLPPCDQADVSMHRLLRGRDTQSDRNVLDPPLADRLDAIRRLRDAEPFGSTAWHVWNPPTADYAAEAAGLANVRPV
jgi:hypothetical protein